MNQRLSWIRAYEESRDAAAVCARFGIARATLRKWWGRYEAGGIAALAEGDRAPRRSPARKAFAADVAAIREMRARGLSLAGVRDALRAERATELSIPTIRRILAREAPAARPVRRAGAVPRSGIVATAGLDEGLAAAIADAIGRGRFQPGEKLTEEGLARAFGVGRTRVREALRGLSFLGLVTLERNRGASVALPSPAEVARAYEARRAVESGIVAGVGRRFGGRCDCAELGILRAHVARQEAAERAGQRVRLIQLLTEFHLVLAGMADNPFLLGFLERLVSVTSLAVLLHDREGDQSCAVDAHRAIVEAIAAGRIEEAARLMRDHLSGNERRAAAPVPAPPQPDD